MIGLIACLLVTFAYLPQCYNIYKTKNVNGLSIKTFILILVAMVFWMIHAVEFNDIMLFISSLFSFIQNSYIIFMIFKYRNILIFKK